MKQLTFKDGNGTLLRLNMAPMVQMTEKVNSFSKFKGFSWRFS